VVRKALPISYVRSIDWGVSYQPRRRTRRPAVAKLYDIAADHAGGYREGFTRAQALAEILETTPDPDLLAEAAAAHSVAENWYAITAVDLLLEAGADPELIDHYIAEVRSADHGSDDTTLRVVP
jgi:hypothetical protein